MAQLLSPETQYYFDLTAKQWWILPKFGSEWKELPNEEAYRLGLFGAVSSQQCNFLDTDLSQYEAAVSELLEDLRLKSEPGGTKLAETRPSSHLEIGKVLTGDFAKNQGSAPDPPKSDQNVRFEEKGVDSTLPQSPGISPQLSKQSSSGDHGPRPSAAAGKEGGSENLLSQINDLIASTTQMKQICKAKELSAQSKGNAPTVRSTARHLTYVNNGGLAGCLKTVAEERKKMGNSKKVVSQAQNAQLQEMIQRAKAMAAKTMDEAREPEPAPSAKEPQEKRAQLRSSKKKYTTVFGAAALSELRLNQQLPDVTFEASSEEESDEEHGGKKGRGGSGRGAQPR